MDAKKRHYPNRLGQRNRITKLPFNRYFDLFYIVTQTLIVVFRDYYDYHLSR